MPLMSWLQDKIWPNEAKLTAEDIYWGTKLACLEMIKSGTTAFVDMYFKHKQQLPKAVEEMGIRASVAITCMDQFKDDVMEQLSLIGANAARFKYEDAKIVREMRNTANRQTNFEAANIEKVNVNSLRLKISNFTKPAY